MRDLNHLSEIFHSYDTYIIDLWGVMHNGISLNLNAIEAVENLSDSSKKIVFLSNAPRPSYKVVEFLKRMKMADKFLSQVVTSGEAAMNAINKNNDAIHTQKMRFISRIIPSINQKHTS